MPSKMYQFDSLTYPQFLMLHTENAREPGDDQGYLLIFMLAIAGKFGGLAVDITTTKLKSTKNFLLAYNYTYGDPVPNRQI